VYIVRVDQEVWYSMCWDEVWYKIVEVDEFMSEKMQTVVLPNHSCRQGMIWLLVYISVGGCAAVAKLQTPQVHDQAYN